MTIKFNKPQDQGTPPTQPMQDLGQALLDVLSELKAKSVILGLESEVDNHAESLVIVGAMIKSENRMEYAAQMSALHKLLIKKFKEAEKS